MKKSHSNKNNILYSPTIFSQKTGNSLQRLDQSIKSLQESQDKNRNAVSDLMTEMDNLNRSIKITKESLFEYDRKLEKIKKRSRNLRRTAFSTIDILP